jgi:L-lactate dehydrogenase (cytochrome)
VTDPALDRRFPDAAALEVAARRRIPGFARGYLDGGIGPEDALVRNIAELRAVRLMPRYLVGDAAPDTRVTVAGVAWSAPLAVAPLGLGGLIWPGSEAPIARAAAAAGVGHVLSTFATSALEAIAPLAGAGGWFQLYPPADPGMEADLIARARVAGYGGIMVTVDIPGATRRRRDMMSGLVVPPRFGLRMLAEIAARPAGAAGMARAGMPAFATLAPYFPAAGGPAAAAAFIGRVMAGHIGPERLARIRAAWPGRLIVKGILDPAEAAQAFALGADGIVVSNHGGRQLDAAPTAPAVLPAIRDRLGGDALVLADGGVRSGLDVARMVALGADAVLIGRPFLHAAAALGARGPAHLIALLCAELEGAMVQLGCARLADLRGRLWQGAGG